MGDRTYNFDANLLLSDNAAAYTADGYAQVGGADAVSLNLGGNQGVTPTQQARIDAVCVIDVTAIDVASTDETYRFKVLGSNTADFAAYRVLTEMTLGCGAQKVPASTLNDGTGRYEQPFTTEQANTKYQYVKLYMDVSGTTPSIAFQAFVSVLPEP
jgi:hypothetical protein